MTDRPLDLAGLWVPIITPFDDRDEVDLEGIVRLSSRLFAEGTRGLVALGTTGEPATLSSAERTAVIEVCDDRSRRAGRPVIVGTGSNSTRATVAATTALDRYPSVAAALVVVPYYTRPSIDAIVEHYRVVAAESPVPVVVYNVPYRTGRGLDGTDLVRIASLPNIVGVKQAVGAVDVDTLHVLAEAPAGFQVLAGDDAFIAPTVLLGGVGAIAAAAHVCTRGFVELVEAAARGDVDRSRSLAEALLPVVRAGFDEPNPAVWKAALHRQGEIATPHLRAPMSGASAPAVDRLVAAIAAVAA